MCRSIFIAVFLFLCAASFRAQSGCAVNAGNDAVICLGQTVQLGGSPTAGSDYSPNPAYNWNNGANDVANPVVSPSVTTTYTVELNSQACGTRTDNVVITVIAPKLGGAQQTIYDDELYYVKCVSGGAPGNIFVNNANPAEWNNYISSHIIDWGDGSPPFTSSDNAWPQQGHNYTPGVYTLTYSFTGPNNCPLSSTYKVFVGNTPAVGLNIPMNTEGCIPITVNFPISNALNNVPGTTYNVIFSDGEQVTLSHPPPAFVTHTFTESSCGFSFQNGTITEQNAFGVNIQAVNPCGSSSASVGPIRLSEPPTSAFTVNPDPACVNSTVTIANTADPGSFVTGANCNSNAQFYWNISPATGWTVQSGSLGSSNGFTAADFAGWSPGSQNLNVIFSTPGTYTISQVIANGCGQSSSQKQLCVVPPVVANYTHSSAGCAPFTLTTNNQTGPSTPCSPPTYNWSFSPTTGAAFSPGSSATSLNPSFDFSLAGTYSITLAATNACGTTTSVKQIVVKSQPTVVLNQPVPGCAPHAVVPSATIGNGGGTISGYNWSISPASGWSFSSGSSNSPTPALLFTQPGTYTITLAVTNECGTKTTSTTVAVRPVPTVTVNDPTACAGVGASLTATGTGGTPNYSFSWSPSTGLNTTSGNTVIATPAGTTNYTVTVTDLYGCTDTDEAIVTVNPLPVVQVNNATICVGASTLLTATGANTYSWTPPGTLSAATGPSVTATPITTTTYTVTGTNTVTGCSKAVTSLVTVNPLPVVNAGQDITFCDQPVAQQLTGTPSGGTWTGPHVNASGVFMPNGEGVFTLTYTYTQTSTGCTNTDNVIVTVTAPATANAGVDLSICHQASPLSLTGTPSGGTWTGSGVSGSTFTPSSVGVFTLTYTYGGGSCLTTDQMQVTVNALPATQVNNGVMCAGTSVVLNATGADTYSWTPAGSLSAATGASVTATPSATTTYTVTGTNSATGCSKAVTSQVTVNPLPVVNAGQDVTFCDQPLPQQLTGTPSGGTWSGPHVSPAGIFTPAGSGVFTLTYTYTLSSTGCTNTDQVVITVNAAAIANAGADQFICHQASPLTLSGTPSGGTWTGLGVSGSTFTPSVVGVFTLTYSYGGGSCLTTDQMQVTVHALPATQVGNAAVCAGSSVVLTASGADTYSWSPPAGLNTVTGPSVTATPPSSTTYSVTGTHTLTGCSKVSAAQVTVHPLPVVSAGPDLAFCDQPMMETLSGHSPQSPGQGVWSGPGIVHPSGQFLSPGMGTYELVYTYTDLNGCINSDATQVTISAPATVNAGPDIELCQNEGAIALQNYVPASGGQWSGSLVIDAIDGIILPELEAPGTHSLILENGQGSCYSIDTVQVTVLSLPPVSAGPNQPFCANAGAFVLTGYTPSLGGIWEGTGVNANGNFSPVNGPGLYNVLFHYTDPISGCADTSSKLITVHAPPVAEVILPSIGCLNAPVAITHTSELGDQYTWATSDGQSSNQYTPGFLFDETGDVSIDLLITDVNNCTDEWSGSIEIIDIPDASFMYDLASGCAPLPVSITNETHGLYTSYVWDFGFITSDQEDPGTIIFPGGDSVINYVVELIAENMCGVSEFSTGIEVYPQPDAEFAVNMDEGCSPLKVFFMNLSVGLPDSYQWNWGDGSPLSSSANPVSHTFFTDSTVVDYTVMLVLSNACGSDTAQHTITVYPNTVQSFFFTDELSGCAPLTVSFADHSSGATQVQFNFGDGSFTAEENPVHLYTDPGVYDVLHVADNGCAYDSSTVQITVLPSPLMNVDVSQLDACQNEPVQFQYLSGDAFSIQWDFGDGNVSSLSTEWHAYSEPGTYAVIVTGENIFGCVGEQLLDFVVHANPDAQLALDEATGCSPHTVCFSSESVGAAYYQWSFGDGNVSVNETACNTFFNEEQEPVEYNVILYVQSQQLCYDSAEVTVNVKPTPESSFTLSTEESCYFPQWVEAINTTLGAGGYQWFLNDQPYAQTTHTSFTLDDVGAYEVELVSVNMYGCVDSSAAVIDVYPLPVLDFEIDQSSGCAPHEVTFENESSGATEYIWDFGDGSTGTGQEVQHVYYQSGWFDVSLIATTADGCVDTLSMEQLITVYPVPVADFVMDPTSANIMMPLIEFTDQSIGATQWYWDFGDLQYSSDENPAHKYEKPGNFTIVLYVSNGYGCTSRAQNQIAIGDQFVVYVPNTFTPQADGTNDAFSPSISAIQFIAHYTFRVFDRWGTVIFETHDPFESWMGNVRDGGYYAEEGVYQWQVIVIRNDSDEPYTAQGHVMLVR